MKSKSIVANSLLVGALAAGSLAGSLVFAAASTPVGAAAQAQMGPQQVVENSAKRMLDELDAHRAMYRKDPAKLDALVANVLLPNFDSEYAARLVLGPAWRTATPDQRKRFVSAFYHSLLHSYGAALVDFTANRFHILPYRGDPGATQATVRTFVMRSNGTRVPVDFTLHKTPGGWKAWDVVIEGISYVKSFRTDFASEIQQRGLEEVITRLEKQNGAPSKSAAVKKARSAG